MIALRRICMFSFLWAFPFVLANAADPAYEAEILWWRADRIEKLRGPGGYINLAGLFRLNEGIQTIGFAESDTFRLDKAKPRAIGTIGEFRMEGEAVTFSAGLPVTNEGGFVERIEMEYSDEEAPTILELGSLRWFVIARGEQTLVRVRDLEAPFLETFEGFRSYPIDPALRLEATFTPSGARRPFFVRNIIGEMEEMVSTGTLTVTIDGTAYELEAADEGEKLFVIFADSTNGSETYGSGRFVYVEKPQSGNKTILDFNKAYNPPCAYSEFTTCPLPPKQNVFPFPIRAGELVYGSEP